MCTQFQRILSISIYYIESSHVNDLKVLFPSPQPICVNVVAANIGVDGLLLLKLLLPLLMMNWNRVANRD